MKAYNGLWHLAVSVLVYICSMGSIKSEISCPPPDVPADGSYLPRMNKYLPGDKVFYTCKQGFDQQGYKNRTCLSSGNWSNYMPFCDWRRTLEIKLNPEENNSNFLTATRVIDGNISTCFLWYKYQIPTLEMCIEDQVVLHGIWFYLNIGPANLQIYSGLRNNMKFCSNFDKDITEKGWYSSVCDYDSWADSIMVTNAGSRSNVITVCEISIHYINGKDVCSLPPDMKIPNGYFEVGRNNATLHCMDGFKAVNSKMFCDKNVWTGLGPRCEEAENICEVHVDNSTLDSGTEWIFLDSFRKLSPGTRRQIKCSLGYKIVGGPEIITCQKNGTWTKTNATCIVDVSEKAEKKLLHHLFEDQDYDKRFRPVKDSKTAIPVEVGLTPLEMQYKIEENIPMRLDTWLSVKWRDEYLTWNPTNYDNIEQLILPISEVWSPDLSLYHNNLDCSFLSDENSNVIVRFDGELTWVTFNSVLAQFDDELNTCTISIMARTYDVSLMKVNAERQNYKSLSHFKNQSWKLKSMEVSDEPGNFSWSKRPFSIIHFNLKFEERENREK